MARLLLKNHTKKHFAIPVFLVSIDASEKSFFIKFFKFLAFQANAKTSVLDVSESEQQQRLFLQKLKHIPVKSLPVALSLFKDYPDPFVFTKPVPSHPKIPNCLREFYKPSISKD